MAFEYEFERREQRELIDKHALDAVETMDDLRELLADRGVDVGAVTTVAQHLDPRQIKKLTPGQDY
jgi:sugar phosphate isomerase/epimerase